MKKPITLERICYWLYIAAMLSIMQFALAYVPTMDVRHYGDELFFPIMSKTFAVIFPLCFFINVKLTSAVKSGKISTERYTDFVQGAAAVGAISDDARGCANYTYNHAEDKAAIMLRYPIFYPFGVFGYMVYWALQVLFCYAGALVGRWTWSDILANFQWDILIFGGSGFLVALFVLSFKLLYRNNGKAEALRQIRSIAIGLGVIGLIVLAFIVMLNFTMRS